MARGVILSGYPFYPNRAISIPVEWRATRAAIWDITKSGLVTYVPVEHPDKQYWDQCWDAPLPTTPFPDPALRLRVPGDMSAGFVTDQSLKGRDTESPDTP